ncbi:MAG TPA: hypothetical protein VFO27_08655, partial [Bryobacteraceae bacterium]|nr:hypothetical protein [Bryobacteraceae bacterium]
MAVVCAAFVLLPLTGCKRGEPARLSSPRIHQITEELAKAAADKAPQGSVVKSRRARARSGAAMAEELYVGLRGASVRRD